MTSKDDFKRALLRLGFIQDKNTRRSGSHLRWHHNMFPSIIIGLADHKNTREISPLVRNELLSTMALVLWLKSIDSNHVFNEETAIRLLDDIDTYLAEQILERAKRIDFSLDNSVVKTLPKKLLQEMIKRNVKLSNAEIVKHLRR